MVLLKICIYLVATTLGVSLVLYSLPIQPTSQELLNRDLATANSSPTSNSTHNSAHRIHSSKIALFVFISLLWACFIMEIKKKTGIPFSPMLLISGMLAGAYSEELFHFGDAVELVNQIDPHTLLMIFIPGLMFESAYNTDGYVIAKSKWQILILAGPGVLLTAVVIALSLLYVFQYSDKLTLPEALVIGSILSTTDPVAVVTLLKELGTSAKFNTLLEGESLLNDGTGFVFFLICLDVAIKGTFNAYDSLLKFVQLTFGGVALGLLFGFFTSIWIKRIMRDHSLVIMITFVSAYLIFVIAEEFIHVSGILAIVSFGIYLSNTAKLSLRHEIDHSVHTVWSFIAFLLETLIFILTGTYIGDKIKHFDKLALETSDIWKVILFFPYLNIIRFLILLV